MKMKLLLLSIFTVACSHPLIPPQKQVSDPWHGTFLHPSGKVTIVLNHFEKEAISIDILDKSQMRPQGFFAYIKDSIATFKDRTDPQCKLIFQAVNEGIIFTDQCHGTGDNDGLYKRVESNKP